MSERGEVSAWRLVKRAYAESAFDGEGSFRFGGRWNSRGFRMVYVSSTLSLAALEFLVHLDAAFAVPRQVAFPLRIPPGLVEAFAPGGGSSPARGLPDLSESRSVGDRWIREARSAALAVPSAIIPQEINFLLNPAHPDFSKIGIGPAEAFAFDKRLVP
ncbi:MAG: RES family NAD+ phosphorylase [Opitutales bacterium]|nr:RES family NAD+ phosphorylase [Opitutales bacterium]